MSSRSDVSGSITSIASSIWSGAARVSQEGGGAGGQG